MWLSTTNCAIFALTLSFAVPVAVINKTSPTPTYRAILDPLHQTKLYAEVLVPVVKIHKKLGESFHKGEVLIQFQGEVFYRHFLKAQADVARAHAKLDATQRLYADKISSEYELKVAEAELADAQATLATATKKFEDTQIRAPYNGSVENVNIEEAELPIEDIEVIEVVDDSILVAKFLVPSNQLHNFRIGQPLIVEIKETGEIITTKVTRIGAMIDASSSTIKIEADIPNSERRTKAGMVGLVTLERRADD